MIIHSPIVSGSLTFANGATLTPPADATYSGSFSGSFVGDGSNLAGVTSYTNADTLTYINSLEVVSGSEQISLSGFNTDNLSEGSSNLYFTDARVKTKLNADGVISGSGQLTATFDDRYLQPGGDNIVSQSAQISGTSITNNTITIAGTSIALGGTITFSTMAEATNVVSGSSQVTSSLDLRYLEINGDDVISGSDQVNADSITNFDSNVKDKLNADGVISGSGQLTTTFDDRYLQPEGDGVVSGSEQISGTSITNNTITIAGTSTALGDTLTFSTITSGTGTITGSQQVVLNDAVKTGFDTADVAEGSNKYYTDARVKTKLNTEGVLSGSISSADITDVAAFSQSGTYAGLRAQGTTAGDVGLGNVTNESKSTMFTSPTFTGTPISTTPTSNDDSTKIATTAYVQQELTDLVGTAGSTLDTLGELSASLSEDSGSLASLVTTVGTKLAKSSNLSDLSDASTARTNLGVAIGSDVQAFNSTLGTVAGGTYVGDDSIVTIGTVTTGNVTSILPSGVVSGSDQVQALGGVNNNTITFTAGNGLVGGGAVTLNQGSDETITFTVGGGVISGSEQVSGITNTQLAGSIAASKLAGSIGNSKLSNSSITIDGTAVSLGGTVTTLQLGTTGTTALAGNTTTISEGQASAITTNTGKVSYTDEAVKDKLNVETVISQSAQVDYGSIQNQPTTITGGQALAITTNTNKVGYTDTLVKTKLNADGVISGSEQIEGNFLEINGDGVVSQSAQIDHDSTTNFVANEHIDHSSISVGSGKGLSGGGTIDTSRSLTLDTGSVHFTDGVKAKLNSETVISQSSQISGITNTQLAGAIANGKLSNSSIEIDGVSISLGGSVTTLQLGTSSTTALAGDTTTISGGQASAITANTNKVSYTDEAVKDKLNVETVISGSDQITALGFSTTDNELTTEEVQDIVGGMVSSNTESGISVTYDDIGNSLDFSVTSQTENDFTTVLKDKLDGIEGSAEVNLTAAETRTLLGTGNGNLVPSAGSSGEFLKHDGTFGTPSYTTNTNTQLTQEQVEDFVGGMLDGTETGITVGYDDVNGNLDFVVASQTDENFTTADHSKLDGIEANADVTDTVNVHPILDARAVLSGSISSANITDVEAFSQSGTYSGLRAQGTTAGDVGLGNVTNESKATMFSGAALTNNPTAPTQTGTNDSTRIATTAFVQSRIDSVIGTAGSTLDTLGELSSSLNNDSGSLASLVTTVGGKLQKDQNLSDLTDASTARTNLGVDASGTINYTLPLGTSTDRGGFKIGYSENGKNYPIELDSEKMYVNVPWVDTNTNTQLSNEEVQDIVGGMLGGTETGITVTYQDTTNDIDFVVASQTDNNFTNTLKDKLDGIEANADVTDSENVIPILNTNTVISGSDQITALGFSTTDNELTTEEVQDIVGGMVSSNTESGISVTYDDIGNSLDFSVTSQTENDFTTVLKDKLDGIEGSAEVNLTAAETRTLLGTGNSGVIPTAGTAGHFLKHDGTFGLPSYTTNTDTNTQLSDEEVQDIVGGMLSGTETGITVTYQDITGDIDFVVASQTDNNFTNTLKDKLDGIEANADVTDAANVLSNLPSGVISGSEQVSGVTNNQLAGSIANGKLANSSITINGSAISLGDSVTTPNDNTQLSTEAVQDIVGGMFSTNTETRVEATYDDGTGKINIVVDDMTANDNTQLSSEAVQDIVGAMFTGNTETRISAVYQDADGTIDLTVNDMTANDNTQNTTTLSFVDSTNDIILRNTTGGHSTSTQDIKLVAGSNITLTHTDANNITLSSTDTNTVYTHPTHDGDDLSVDTGTLSGATVISDIDFNVNTDTLGHVTDATLTTLTTRELTLADLGYTGATDANNYVLPTDLDGDDITVDTGELTGATVISDLDFNITTNTSGLVTDANGSVSTRTLTLADLGYTGDTDANNFTYTLPEATTTTRGGIELFSDTDQSVAANTVSATANRTYGIQLNSAGQAVVNVPWSDTDTDTVYTHPSHDGDDIALDTSGAQVIDTLTITTNGLGHVTDASVSTRDLTPTNIGLGNVTNESKATMFSSPALTGNPTAPTQTGTNSSTRLATTAFVQGRIDAIIGNAGSTLDTLGELSASLDSDSGSLASLVTTVGGKLQKDQNLSDLADASTARTNLGLGNVANTAITVSSTSVSDGTNTFNKATLSSLGTDAFDEDGTYTSLRAQGTTKGDVGLGNVENTALSTYTGNGGALDNQYIANGANYISSFDITAQTDSKYLRSNANDTATGIISITNSTASTSKTSGALKVTGGVGISGALNVGGDVVAYASSDERLKDNIELISNPIEKVQSLKGVTWNWNDNADELQKSLPNVGVIAQDVEKVLPELVTDRDNGYKGVDYAKLTGLLIEAIKEQQKEINSLKEKLK